MALFRLFFRLVPLFFLATALVAAQETARVTLLLVNDVYQYAPVDRGARGGLGRVLTLKKRIQAESPDTLFLLAGDTISPSVESLKYKGAQMIDAWNAVGLDYAVFGNHEFDFGPQVLLERMNESKFVWLNANVVNHQTGATFGATPPFVVRDIGGVKIGLLGIVLPDTKTTSKPGAENDFLSPCETAAKYVPLMQSQGAGVIVALTHLSMRGDKELARCAPAIDLILGGHEHTLLQSLSGRAPIFKMTSDARELGQFDLYVNRATGRLENMDWKVIPVTAETPEDPAFVAAMSKYQAYMRELAQRVGRTTTDIDARSAAGRQRETNAGSFIADAFRAAVKSDAAILNGGSIRADDIIPAGPLTRRDVLALLPYPDPVLKLQVTGATLRAALEHGLKRAAPTAEPGEFPQVSGLRYVYNAAAAPGARLVSITINGKPLDDAKTYTLAAGKFIAEGGDGYAMLKDAPRLVAAEQSPKAPDILHKTITAAGNKGIAPRADGRIQKQ
jgi:5'-nucleotidase